MFATEYEERPMERLYDNARVHAFIDEGAMEAYVEVREGAAEWAVQRAVEWVSNYNLYPLDPTGVTHHVFESDKGQVKRYYCVPLGFGAVG